MNTTPLVGREEELTLLSAALDNARRGKGSMHWIAGDGGVGKTRLTSAVQEVAQGKGITTVTGRAFPVETGIPYALFADAFVPMLREMPATTLQTLSRGGAAELGLLFPVLRTETTSTRMGDASELKPRLLDAFSQMLQRLARKQPMLVVLENLQWADPSSFDLLHFVGRSAEAQPLLILCTYNEAQRDTNRLLRTTEQSLLSLGAMTRHLLPPLSVQQTVELLERQFGVAPDVVADFAALVHARTRGNPFFIEETLKALTQSGRLRREGERWTGWETDKLELPRSIREVLHARFERLSQAAQDIIVLAAVVGAQVPHSLLEALSGVPQETLLAAIEELLDERVLVESQQGEHLAYDFVHPLMQEVLYSEIARARVRTVHAQIADALEQLYGDRALDHADALAVHFRRAENPLQADRACRYLTAAGVSALERGASREAADTLRAALEIAERGDDTDSREELRDQLARALNRLGDYQGAAALWADALSRAKPLGEHRRIAAIERRLGVTALRMGIPDDALRHMDRGLEAATTSGVGALIASLRLSRSVVLLDVGRGDDAERDLRAALAVAQEIGDPRMLARVHQALQTLAVWRGPSEDARTHGVKALEYAIEAGDRPAQWAAHWATAVHAGLTGDAPGTAAHMADAQRLAAELRSPLLKLWTADVEIEYGSGVGDWDRTLALAERAIADARAFRQRTLLPRLLVWSGLVHFGRGDLERGKLHVDEAWQLSGADRAKSGLALTIHTVVPAHLGLASWHLYRKEYRAALEVGEAGLAIADRTGYEAWGLHRLMPLCAEASLWVRDWDRAERYGRRLRETATRLGHPLAIAWSDASFALMRMLKGDKPGAIEQLRHAADALDAIPFAEHAARLRRKLADAYLGTGDEKAAIAELRLIHDVFVRLGAKDALADTRDKLRELNVRLPATRQHAGAGAGALTAREWEIAQLVEARKENKEIGVALGISSRTVGKHLSNIFVKLQIESRGELVDYVRGLGVQ